MDTKDKRIATILQLQGLLQNHIFNDMCVLTIIKNYFNARLQVQCSFQFAQAVMEQCHYLQCKFFTHRMFSMKYLRFLVS